MLVSEETEGENFAFFMKFMTFFTLKCSIAITMSTTLAH